MTAVIDLSLIQSWEITDPQPYDADDLAAFAMRCSSRTMYGRFFTSLRALPPAYLNGLLAGDPDRHDAVITRVRPAPDGSGRIVAEASVVATGDGDVELGVLVEDGWQRRGLGASMVEVLRIRARDRGVRRMHATVLPSTAWLLPWLGRIMPMERSSVSPYAISGTFRLL